MTLETVSTLTCKAPSQDGALLLLSVPSLLTFYPNPSSLLHHKKRQSSTSCFNSNIQIGYTCLFDI